MGFLKFLNLFHRQKDMIHEVSFDLKPTYPTLNKRSTIRSTRIAIPTPVHIPMEIVLNIIEAAYRTSNDNSEGTNDPDTLLRHCALVCRDWCAPAQKLLFHNVTLRNQSAYLAFQHAVDRSQPRGRILGDAVVLLRIVLDHNQPFGLTQHSFARAVTLCPNLCELSLALYGRGDLGEDVVGLPDVSRTQRPAPSFDDTTLSLLTSGPCITALRFNNWSENRESLTQLLDVWPTLRTLIVSGTPPQLSSTTSEPFPGALEELRMNFQAPPSLDFMKSLLHNSKDSLRLLEFEREPSSDLLHYLVDIYGPSLQTLALPACSSKEHALAVQQCHQLRELKIESPWVSPTVFHGLSEVLQHVALGLDMDTPLQPVLDIVKTRKSLGVVTVHVWHGGQLHPQLPALKIACAYRGIDLKLTYDIRAFRALIRGDSVSSTYLPRATSL